jgi:hypothetical protein
MAKTNEIAVTEKTVQAIATRVKTDRMSKLLDMIKEGQTKKLNRFEMMNIVTEGITCIAENDFSPVQEKAVTRDIMKAYNNSVVKDENDKAILDGLNAELDIDLENQE